jgi:hypothetical protein
MPRCTRDSNRTLSGAGRSRSRPFPQAGGWRDVLQFPCDQPAEPGVERGHGAAPPATRSASVGDLVSGPNCSIGGARMT